MNASFFSVSVQSRVLDFILRKYLDSVLLYDVSVKTGGKVITS